MTWVRALFLVGYVDSSQQHLSTRLYRRVKSSGYDGIDTISRGYNDGSDKVAQRARQARGAFGNPERCREGDSRKVA